MNRIPWISVNLNNGRPLDDTENKFGLRFKGTSSSYLGWVWRKCRLTRKWPLWAEWWQCQLRRETRVTERRRTRREREVWTVCLYPSESDMEPDYLWFQFPFKLIIGALKIKKVNSEHVSHLMSNTFRVKTKVLHSLGRSWWWSTQFYGKHDNISLTNAHKKLKLRWNKHIFLAILETAVCYTVPPVGRVFLTILDW